MSIGGPAQAARPVVVVGVDGSRSCPAVVDLAAAAAALRRLSLLIVHAWPGRYTGLFRGHGVLPSAADGRRLLDVSASRVGLAEAGLAISTEMVDGAAAQVLAGFSETAGLLVVGHRDEDFTRPSWGSTAAYLAHHSACPLLVHRGGKHQNGPVVVATSARPAGGGTLGYAFTEATLLRTRLVVIHMWTRPGAMDARSPPSYPAVTRPSGRRPGRNWRRRSRPGPGVSRRFRSTGSWCPTWMWHPRSTVPPGAAGCWSRASAGTAVSPNC